MKRTPKRWSDSKGIRERRYFKSFGDYELKDKEHEIVFGMQILSYMQGKTRKPCLI